MDKYISIKSIGEGSFGKAILVQERHSTKLFLMKVIDVRKIDKKSRQKTHNEITHLKSLNHPNIVKYRESFVHLEWAKQSLPVHNHAVRLCRGPAEPD